MKNVYIVAASDVIARWINTEINFFDGFEARTFVTGDELVAAIPNLQPGTIVMDIDIPGPCGVETFARYKDVKHRFPTILILGKGDIYSAVQAMRLGIEHVLIRPFSPREIITALDDCASRVGQSDSELLLNNAAGTRGGSSFGADGEQRTRMLTQREKDILRLLVKGLTNRQIAGHLSLSLRTVETYRARMMGKLQAASLPEAINFACTHGLATMADIGSAKGMDNDLGVI